MAEPEKDCAQEDRMVSYLNYIFPSEKKFLISLGWVLKPTISSIQGFLTLCSLQVGLGELFLSCLWI